MKIDIPRILEGQEYQEGLAYKLFATNDNNAVFMLVMRAHDRIIKLKFEPDGVSTESYSIGADRYDEHADCKLLLEGFEDMLATHGLI